VYIEPCFGTEPTKGGSSFSDPGLTFFVKGAVVGQRRIQGVEVVDKFEYTVQ